MPRGRDWDAIKEICEDLEIIERQIAESTIQRDTIADDLAKLRQRQETDRRKLESLLYGTVRGDEPASPSSNVEASK